MVFTRSESFRSRLSAVAPRAIVIIVNIVILSLISIVFSIAFLSSKRARVSRVEYTRSISVLKTWWTEIEPLLVRFDSSVRRRTPCVCSCGDVYRYTAVVSHGALRVCTHEKSAAAAVHDKPYWIFFRFIGSRDKQWRGVEIKLRSKRKFNDTALRHTTNVCALLSVRQPSRSHRSGLRLDNR